MVWRRSSQLVRLLRESDWKGFWRRTDRAVDHLDWAWNSIMLYFTAFLVMPLLVLAIIAQSALVPPPATPIGPQGTLERVVLVLLCGLPVWLAIAAFARFSAAPLARRIQSWINWMFWKIIWTNAALMALFGLLLILV